MTVPRRFMSRDRLYVSRIKTLMEKELPSGRRVFKGYVPTPTAKDYSDINEIFDNGFCLLNVFANTFQHKNPREIAEYSVGQSVNDAYRTYVLYGRNRRDVIKTIDYLVEGVEGEIGNNRYDSIEFRVYMPFMKPDIRSWVEKSSRVEYYYGEDK